MVGLLSHVVGRSGAAWVSLSDIKDPDFPLRGAEPYVWCPYVAAGGHVSPLSVLGSEGMSYRGALMERARAADALEAAKK